jgi:hypothetical protein
MERNRWRQRFFFLFTRTSAQACDTFVHIYAMKADDELHHHPPRSGPRLLLQVMEGMHHANPCSPVVNHAIGTEILQGFEC